MLTTFLEFYLLRRDEPFLPFTFASWVLCIVGIASLQIKDIYPWNIFQARLVSGTTNSPASLTQAPPLFDMPLPLPFTGMYILMDGKTFRRPISAPWIWTWKFPTQSEFKKQYIVWVTVIYNEYLLIFTILLKFLVIFNINWPEYFKLW